MKKIFYILLFISVSTFAQGIAVQGIARTNEESAILNTNLTFTFSIVKQDNSVLFKESQGIKTDGFGVFSHIVGSGNPSGSAFSTVDFSIPDLKLKVSINYNGEEIEVYDQPFQYTPYAHFAKKAALATNAINATNAANGVPTGAIMPFMGETAPVGWVLCKGQNIASVTGSEALRTLLNSSLAPNLQGMFLRGAGTNTFTSVTTVLGGSQNHTFQSHMHDNDFKIKSNQGQHNHNIDMGNITRAEGGYGTNSGVGNLSVYQTRSGDGGHNHTVEGSVWWAGVKDSTTGMLSAETRPVNYGVNYIIKL